MNERIGIETTEEMFRPTLLGEYWFGNSSYGPIREGKQPKKDTSSTLTPQETAVIERVSGELCDYLFTQLKDVDILAEDTTAPITEGFRRQRAKLLIEGFSVSRGLMKKKTYNTGASGMRGIGKTIRDRLSR